MRRRPLGRPRTRRRSIAPSQRGPRRRNDRRPISTLSCSTTCCRIAPGFIMRPRIDEADDRKFASSAKSPASKAMRSVVDTSGSRLGREHVARAAHGVEERPFEALVDLAAQPADMDVDDVGAGIEAIVPDRSRSIVRVTTRPSLRAKYSSSGTRGAGGRARSAARHAARERVEFEVAAGDGPRRPASRGGATAPSAGRAARRRRRA